MAISSTNENGVDMLIYFAPLKDSNTVVGATSSRFDLPLPFVTPLQEQKESAPWIPEDFSPDDTRLLLMSNIDVFCTPLHIADLTADLPTPSRTHRRPAVRRSGGETNIYGPHFSPDLIYFKPS